MELRTGKELSRILWEGLWACVSELFHFWAKILDKKQFKEGMIYPFEGIPSIMAGKPGGCSRRAS